MTRRCDIRATVLAQSTPIAPKWPLTRPGTAMDQTGERGGVSPPILRRMHRGADATPLARMFHGWPCEAEHREATMSDSRKLAVSVAESDADLIAALLLKFDRGWDAGKIDTFVMELTGWPPEARGRALVMLVKIDLERRWQSGHNTEVEQYLARFPELGTADTVTPELLLAEWEVRQQYGEQPRFGDFTRRFPRQTAALQQLIRQSQTRESMRRQAAPDEPSQHDTSKVLSQHASSHPNLAPTQAGERGGVSPPVLSDLDLPEHFGRYRILKKLGGGGMGTVYLAEDSQLDRQVALKVPHFNSQTSAEILQRFEREAKTAAKLSHANICQLFDVGQIDGRHFLTMEYIDGRPLTKLVGSKSLTDKLAIQLVRQIAIAVGAAHKQNIIHRDLKPANIMLTSDGKPKVTDFGLARRVGANDQHLTQTGMIIGTPAYMPLEQLNGALDQIGPHSDVYSLGVILYELLTGHLPFDVPPDAPVTALFAKILTAPPDPPTKYRPDLDPRLEAIVLKAIAKQQADRYRTMGEFADALAEYRRTSDDSRPAHDEPRRTGGVSPPVNPNDVIDPMFPGASPVGGLTPPARLETVRGDDVLSPIFTDSATDSPNATPGPKRQRGKKSPSFKTTVLISAKSWYSRWIKLPFPTQVVCLCLGFTFLLGVTIWFRSGDALVKIEVHADDVEVTFQNETIKVNDGAHEYKVKPGDHTLHIKSGNAEFYTDKFTLKKGDNPAVTVELVKSEIVSRLGKQEVGRHRLRPKPDPDWDPADFHELFTLTGHTDRVISVAFSPDGKRLASAGWDQAAKVWDAASGQEMLTLKGHTKPVTSVAFSPDGKRLASASHDRTVMVWDTMSGQETLTLQGHTNMVTSVAFSADGKRLASSSNDGTVKVWDATSGQETLTLKGHTDRVTSLAFSADGKRLASAGRDNTVKVWDAMTGQETLTLKGHTDWVKSVAFRADGKRLASASDDWTLKVWDATSGQETLTLKGHTRRVFGVAFSPDGKRLASASEDQTVKVWDATSGQETLTLKGHTGQVESVAFSPDGKRLASASFDKTVKVWGAGIETATEKGPGSIASKKNDYDAIATEHWMKLTDLAAAVKGNPGARIVDGAIEVTSVADNDILVPAFRGQDAIIRAKVKRISGSRAMKLSLRSPDEKLTCLSWVNDKGDVGISDGENLIERNRVAPTDGEFELAFSAKGNQLRCYVNGKLVAEATTPHPAVTGLAGFNVRRGTTQFKDIEFMSLDAVPSATLTTVALSSAAVKEMQATLQKAFKAKVTVQSSGLVEFIYDFSDPRQLDDWIVREPQSEWAVEDGWLVSKKLASKNASDTRLYHRAFFAGPRREIHYDAQGKHDLSAVFFSDLVQWREGYWVCVAGFSVGEEHVGFYYAPKTGSVNRPDGQKLGFTRVGPLDPTKTYRVNAVAEGGKVSLAFNGEVLSSGTIAPEFLQTGRMTCLKLGYSHGKFDNVRVVGAPDPQWYAEIQRTGVIPSVGPSYPKPLIRWPAAALSEGRIPAPNLEHAKVLFNDQFDDPKSGWPQGKKENPVREYGYQKGKYSIRILGPRVYRGYLFDTPIKDLNEFACEVAARADASARKWGLHLLNAEKMVGISLCVQTDGTLEIWPGWDGYHGPYTSVFAHGAINKGNELNKLLAVVRGRQVEIYINGVAVCDPVTMPADFTPVTVKLSFHSGKEAEAQFERVTVWSAEGLPTPKERLEKGEVPAKTTAESAPRSIPLPGNAQSPVQTDRQVGAATPRAPSETWPEEELRTGKIPAPDLSDLKPLYLDEFDNPKNGFGTYKGVKGHADSGYRDGKYFINGSAGRWNNKSVARGDVAILVRGRSSGNATNYWSISLENQTITRSFRVGVSGEGKLLLGRGYRESIGTPEPLTIEHSAIKKGSEWNELLLVLRGRLLEIYVNDVAVCQPVRLNGDLLPNAQPSLMFRQTGTGSGEFDWLRVYPANELLTVPERLEKRLE